MTVPYYLSIAADEFHFPFANRHTAANSPVMNEYLAFNAYYIQDNLSRYLHSGTDFHAPAETNIYHMENGTDFVVESIYLDGDNPYFDYISTTSKVFTGYQWT